MRRSHFPRALLAGFLASACAANAEPTYRVGATVPGMLVNGLNNRGDMIGKTTPSGSSLLYSNGVLTDLASSLGTGPSVAYNINNRGEIVGVSHPDPLSPDQAFVYSGGRMRDLGTLSGTRSVASDINDLGQITAQACNTEGCFAVRLDPIAAIPEPAANLLLTGGLGMLGVMGGWRRRKNAKRQAMA